MDSFDNASRKNSSFAATVTAATSGGEADWVPALAAVERRYAQDLATLEQSHGERWKQLEERLAAAERTASDLAGQIRELS